MGPGTVVGTPGGGSSGTPAPAVIQSTPAPAGSPATTNLATPPRAATPGGSKKPADAAVPEILEAITLPDGRQAYVRPSPAPAPATAAGGKPGKNVDETTNKTKVSGTGLPTGAAESQQGHCSVCCPTGARTQQGVPIQPCAHQDGPLGNAVPGSVSNKTNNKVKPIPTAAPLNLPGDIAVDNDGPMVPPAPGKLKKNGAAGPAGPSMSPEERAMEDARSLASESSSSILRASESEWLTYR
jgi:hypothetical protein